MSAPRDLGPDFRAWLDDIPPMPPDVLARTLDETRHTGQRRRWLRFLPVRRPAAGAHDREGRPWSEPSNATAPIGGTTMILSPTKLATAAIAAALVGSLLLARPFTTSERSLPAAPDASKAGVITLVEGNMYTLSKDDIGSPDTYDGGPARVDEWWTTEFRTNDARLNGIAVSRHNRNLLGSSGSFYRGSRAITVRLENDGGAWVGSGLAYMEPDTTVLHYRLLLEGQGGYDGLDAIIDLDNPVITAPFKLAGAILSGGLPEFPEPVPAD
jgi:hypothetical protein